ncbi:3'-5' exonuclease-like [Cornus florida]|uniref:3'-5' exonuclease-like n=1 Tax=Cornus florida TaxID=4283 RepID=UPI00289E3926|nr:3'-5' exonuclease-like [Cornus florida]
MAQEIPQSLADFLSDVDFTFVGVGIENDAQKLFDDYGLHVSNWVDLRGLAAGRLNDAELYHAGLVRLAGDVLGMNFQKPKSVTLSDWDANWLSDDQILYAWVDAFVSFEIGRYLNAGVFCLVELAVPFKM